MISRYEKQMDWRSVARLTAASSMTSVAVVSLAVLNYFDPHVPSSLPQLHNDNN